MTDNYETATDSTSTTESFCVGIVPATLTYVLAALLVLKDPLFHLP